MHGKSLKTSSETIAWVCVVVISTAMRAHQLVGNDGFLISVI